MGDFIDYCVGMVFDIKGETDDFLLMQYNYRRKLKNRKLHPFFQSKAPMWCVKRYKNNEE